MRRVGSLGRPHDYCDAPHFHTTLWACHHIEIKMRMLAGNPGPAASSVESPSQSQISKRTSDFPAGNPCPQVARALSDDPLSATFLPTIAAVNQAMSGKQASAHTAMEGAHGAFLARMPPTRETRKRPKTQGLNTITWPYCLFIRYNHHYTEINHHAPHTHT